MALSVVTNLLERLSSPAIDEMKLLGRVETEVDVIKDELEFMRSFLQHADARGETDERVKTWVKQVRNVAYDAEDILEDYFLRLHQPCSQEIFSSFLNCLEYIKHLIARHCLAIKMQHIKTRIRAISERRVFNAIDEGSRVHTTPVQWYDPRIESLYIDEAEVVGIEVPKSILIEWLTKKELKLTIISVVGMGGLGKTTLVKNVYDNQMVKKHFDRHVWITVSQSPVSTRELLRTIIKGVLKETEEQPTEVPMDEMDNSELIEVLKKQLLRKRYVIIFDDIWHINVWEAIKFAFPNSVCGSRIIFTTRLRNIVDACSNHVYILEHLKEKEAWKLFCKKAFRSSNDESSSCPKELEELSRNILKKCSGLPLAIVLIGGLLARKAKTVIEWNNVHDSVGAEMRNNHDLESLGKILLLSYDSLPYYLKPCFMYLSMFPEDYFIRRMTLIRLWIAEGFIEEKQGVTLEVVAGDYLNEFISRSMIQIAEFNRCDGIKSCRIHDLMRETIQSKSKEECFSTIIFGSQGTRVPLHEKARRISIYRNNTCENYDFIDTRCSDIRSFMMFQLHKPPRPFGDEFFCVFRLLRVLDLEGADLVEFPSGLVELTLLRYLSLRGTKISVLPPKSVGKLKNLETLDLKQTRVSELPVEILKLQRLRHLLVYRSIKQFYYTRGVSVPTGIGNLTSLQKLAFIEVQHQSSGSEVVKELGKLTQLRRLGIRNLKGKDGRDLCLALENMEHLSSLSLMITNGTTNSDEFLPLELLLSPPQLLRHLYLDCRLRRLPVWIASLRNLIILKLRSSRLSWKEDDPLKAFQRMPNLEFLQLKQAYNGEILCCDDIEGYQKLKILVISRMPRLKRVIFMKGSMPMLKELKIGYCRALEMVPCGIEHLSGLQELAFVQMLDKFVGRMRTRTRKRISSLTLPLEAQGEGEEEDCWKVQHIPEVGHYGKFGFYSDLSGYRVGWDNKSFFPPLYK